jgi:Spy/CpxP family protein refolding chaperone
MARTKTLPLVLAALFAGAAFASGCSGCDKPADNATDAAPSTSATPASSSATVVASDAAAPDGGEERGRHGERRGGRGPSGMLFHAARELTLPAEQAKKVDAAEGLAASGSDTEAKEAKEAAKDLHGELIAGIKAGKIEPAKLDPKYAVIEKLALAEHDKEVASLNALYAALDAAQRTAVVASVRAAQAKREERMTRRSRDEAGAPDAGKSHAGKRSLERLVRGVDLDAEQQKKIDALDVKASGADPAEAKKRMDALLGAFEKDAFDAKKINAFESKKHRGALEEETKLLSQVLPILKPEQREKLAAKMEKGASPHGPKRGGFGHRPLAESEDDDFAP